MRKLAIIIDNNNYLIKYLKEILETIDNIEIEVIFANNGTDGFKKIEKNIEYLDIIFLDIRMIDVDGITIYNKTRELSSTIPVVFMSGHPMAEISEDPNVYFLPKPFSYEDIQLITEKLKF